MKLHKHTPHELRMALLTLGQKAKGQGHNALFTENSLWRIIAFSLPLSSLKFIYRLPMSLGCTLLITMSKSQRSKPQCIDK